MKVKDILKDGSEWMPGRGYESGNPIVSVLLPTFRRAKSGLFEKAVQSVLKQSLKNIELIIIDDCSTDGTFDLIKYFMKADSRVSCIRHTYNIGLPAISEYEGYLRAKGEYISFIFDDNEWDQDYLDKTISYMVRTHVMATYGVVRSYYGEAAHEYIELGRLNNSVYSVCDLLAINFIANGGVVLHRDVIESVGLYDPHVSVTRNCDWDLWIRIMQKYCFESTGILAGSEYGTKLKDSLGNTVKMNLWCSTEQMCLNRNMALRPSNFLEYDIFATESNSTALFIDNILGFSNQYEEKEWFNREDESFKRLGSYTMQRNEKKRVLVLSNSLDATTTLSFARLSRDNDDMVIRFGTINTFQRIEYIYVDVVICMRNIPALKSGIKICEELEIPCYYYIDDNFIELSKDYKSDLVIKMLAKEINYNSLKRFEGIFLSTQPLLDYFNKNRYHENLVLVEPVMDVESIQEFSSDKCDRNISIAFMGGGFRGKVFWQTVIPAIERLAAKRNITLYLPEHVKNSMAVENRIIKNLKLVEIPYSLSLELTLLRYGAHKPDILIHCGPDIKNNLYKTENSLINAVQMGAVLVTSNALPYKEQNNKKQRFVLAENTEISWYETLLDLVDSPEKKKYIYNNALEYCKDRYHPNKIRKIVNKNLEKTKNTTYSEMLSRYDVMFFDLIYQKNRFSISAGEELKPSRSLTEVPLSLSRLIPDKTSYNIRCKANTFSEIGLCFTSFGECAGYVKIAIYDGKRQLGEANFKLEEYVKDNWTYVSINSIENVLNKVLTIVLEFKYDPGSSYVGVFEDASKRTFTYKVFNKLGHHIKGMDALFLDLR